MKRKSNTALFLSIFFILASCSRSESADDTASSSWAPDDNVIAVSVEVLEITRGQLIPFVEASGTVSGQQEAWTVSETQGKITEIAVQLGQKVKKGDLLLKVEDSLSRLNRDLTLQQYESARHDFEAISKSFQSGGSSKSDYNRARSTVLQAQASFENADKAFNDTGIRAPFAGSVALLDNTLTVGSYLTRGVLVARIVDTTYMKMEISLGERQIGLIKEGSQASVTIGRGEYPIVVEANVTAIGTGSDPATGSFPLLLTWKNDQEQTLRSGLSARVQIVTDVENKNIVIPSSAIINRDRVKSVILEDNGKTVIRSIKTGESLGGQTVILEGLAEGEILIVSALSSLGDNYPVAASVIGTTGEWR